VPLHHLGTRPCAGQVSRAGQVTLRQGHAVPGRGEAAGVGQQSSGPDRFDDDRIGLAVGRELGHQPFTAPQDGLQILEHLDDADEWRGRGIVDPSH